MAKTIRDDLRGRQFGRLTVIEYRGSSRSYSVWLCECVCRQRVEVRHGHLTGGQVKSCGCQNQRSLKGSSSARWTGCGEISGTHWRALLRSAQVRDWPVEITIDEAWHLFLKQERRCALSDLPIYFGRKGFSTTASLDRIDSAKGYVAGNLQWLHKDVNRMKWELPEGYFLQLCQLIVRANRRATQHAAIAHPLFDAKGESDGREFTN